MTTIHFNDQCSLNEAGNLLTEQVPALKIGFFKKKHVKGQGSHKSDMLDGNLRIVELNHQFKGGMVSLKPDEKIFEIEEKLTQFFDLPVQIFRKSGKLWLETTTSDQWSLAQLIEEAELSE